jgi:chromosome segregation ATPase
MMSGEIARLTARLAELEAQCAPDAIQRHYMRGYNAANAKRRRYYVAELESDRDRCSQIIDTLGADSRRLEAEVASQAKEIEFLNDVGDERHAEKVRLEAERDELRGELALVRLAYASVITERDRLRARLKQTGEFIKRWDDGFGYGDWYFPEFKAEYEAIRAALSGEGAT